MWIVFGVWLVILAVVLVLARRFVLVERRRFAVRLREVKRKDGEHLQRERAAMRGAVDLVNTRNREWVEELARKFNLEREGYIRQITDLASRPPIIVKDSSGSIIREVGEAVSKIVQGPPLEPDRGGAENGILPDGTEPGQWFPDVEMDEWLERNGPPTRAGWLPPPTLRTEYVDASPDAVGPPNAPDAIRFKAGHSGPQPTSQDETSGEL